MYGLGLETFFSHERDLELNQYRVLNGLKLYTQEFNRKRIYPALSDLIDLASTLEDIIEKKGYLQVYFPKQIREFDFENKTPVFETRVVLRAEVELFFNLIEWSLPKIKEAIQEGIVIYDFVDKNIDVHGVGLLPMHKEEGYFLIEDNSSGEIQVHKFECSLFSSDDEPLRLLKTKMIRVFQKLIAMPPEMIKLEMIKLFPELPNPATYICETDLEFPLTETIFPVAKRKLMTALAA